MPNHDVPHPDPAAVTATDQSGAHWRLSDHLQTAVLLVFLRGDW